MTQADFDTALLQHTRAIEMFRFEDAQFLHEPRLRMMQSAFHCMRKTTRSWALNGMLGEPAKQDVSQQISPEITAAFANATIQRPTLNPYQDKRIKYAQHIIEQLVAVVQSLGIPGDSEAVDHDAHQFCDLGGATLGVRGYVDDKGVRIYRAFDPFKDAHQPISRLCMVTTNHSKTSIAAAVKFLPLQSRQARDRAMEIAELARWMLRQPAYCPTV